MRKNSTTQDKDKQYKNQYKELKPFVTFNFDLRKKLTKAQKATITKYFKELKRMTDSKPYALQIYRSKDKTKLKKVQELGGQDTRLKNFKVAFVPKTSKYQKIKFNKKGEPQTINNFVKSTFIKLDPEKIVSDGAAQYVYDKVKNRLEKRYSIQAGDYEISGTFAREVLGDEIVKLANQYGNPDANNYIGNWCGGVFAYSFQNQSDLNEYRKSKRNAQLKKDRAARKKQKTKRISVYYWYDRKADTVLITKEKLKPNKHCEEITQREYDLFLQTGEF